jgi:hypothetical protein
VDTNLRIEQSVRGLGMQVLSLSSSVQAGVTSFSGSWSRRRLTSTTPPDNYLSTSASVSANQGRVVGNYSLSWDISRGYLVSQIGRMLYNAQCCGIGVEYQAFSYPQVSSRFPLPSDRRINFSFMLAGLGTFQNFFGAFGGPR